MCDDFVACAGARSQAQRHEIGTEARRAKTSKEVYVIYPNYRDLIYHNL